MVITVEPGLYFSRFALESVYRRDPAHARFINFEILERYYPVGGVRIEDDILVTETGHENLTTAPKGEEACELVRRSLGRGTGGEGGR
jgi:Xaa-Pro dipeptidase